MNKKRKKIVLIILVLIAAVAVFHHFTKNTPERRKAQIEKLLNKTYWIDEDYTETEYLHKGEEVRPGVKYKYEYYFYKDDGKLYCNVKIHVSDEDEEPVCWFYNMFKGEVEIREDDPKEGTSGTIRLKNAVSEDDRYKSEQESEDTASYHYDIKKKAISMSVSGDLVITQIDSKTTDDSPFLEHDTLLFINKEDLHNLLQNITNSEELTDYIQNEDIPSGQVHFSVRGDYDDEKGIVNCYFRGKELSAEVMDTYPEYWEDFMKNIYSIIKEKLYYQRLDVNIILVEEDYTPVYVYTKDGFTTDTSVVDNIWSEVEWNLTKS